MKKKFLTFLIMACLILPCAIIFSACMGGGEPVLNGYDVFINGVKTSTFECVWGEDAITEGDVEIKSNWSDPSKNETIPLSNFDVSVVWRDAWQNENYSIPNFWTNDTGSTTSDAAATYEFTLRDDVNLITLNFSVVISPITVTNCKVRIFDGEQYTYSAEMIWNNNEREEDPEKHVRFDVENLSGDYEYVDQLQWAMIEKDVFDALGTTAEKKAFIKGSQAFSTDQINSIKGAGTYYVFAYVPDWNNRQYGEDGDGFVHEFATLTIKPIELVQNFVEGKRLDHSDSASGRDAFTYEEFSWRDEISTVDDHQFDCFPYVFENGNWRIMDDWMSVDSVKVHAVKIGTDYHFVGLKDHSVSMDEWVFLNADGTVICDVEAGSNIELVDYADVLQYKNGTSIVIPIYYKAIDAISEGFYYDCSKVYKTDVKMVKYLNILVPNVSTDMGGNLAGKYVIGDNTFAFTYGDKYQIDGTQDILASPKEIMQHLMHNYSFGCYEFVGFDETEYSEQPYNAHVALSSPHFGWKLDGVHFSSEPLSVTYFINQKADIASPEYVDAQSGVDYFETPIEIVFDASLETYNLGSILAIEKDILFEESWVNVWSYELSEEDLSLTKNDLANKIKEQGAMVGYDGCFVSGGDNNVAGKTFVVMYDLANKTSTIWDDGSTTPRLLKIVIVAE